MAKPLPAGVEHPFIKVTGDCPHCGRPTYSIDYVKLEQGSARFAVAYRKIHGLMKNPHEIKGKSADRPAAGVASAASR